MPKVSVVIPTYNYARFLAQSLESVLNQTFRDFEVIVVDDGSTDNTRELVSTYTDPRLCYIFQENRGLARSRNTGIARARGELVAFLDSDDVWLPHKLERQVGAFAGQPGLGMVYGQAELIDAQGSLLAAGSPTRVDNLRFATLYENLLGNNLIPGPSSVIIAKVCLDQVGGFDHDCGGVADLDMWRRVARDYPCYEVPEVLTQIRVHGGSMTYSRRAYMAEGMVACIRRATAEVGQDPRYQAALEFAQERMYTHASWYFLEDAAHDFRAGLTESERVNSGKALACWGKLPGKPLEKANLASRFEALVVSESAFFAGENQNLQLALDCVEVIVRRLQEDLLLQPKEASRYRRRGAALVCFSAAQKARPATSWQARRYALRALGYAPGLLWKRAWIKTLLGFGGGQ